MFFELEPIDEAYFGKTPEILDIEKTISAIRKKYTIKDPLKKVLEDKLIDDLTKKICKAFGFTGVHFGFDEAFYYNCYTIPIRQSTYGDLTEKYVVTKDGIKYKPEADCVTMIVCTNTLFFSDKITDGELMAVFLHEIGHNFTEAVVPIELCFDIFKKALETHIISFMSIVTKKAKTLPKLQDILQSINNTISTVPKFLSKFMPDDSFARRFLLNLATDSNKRRYIDEKFADQFATMYGYGKELSSILSKIEYRGGIDETSPVGKLLGLSYGLIDTSMDVMFGNYPLLAARMKSSIQVLEHEIDTNKSLTPEVKADLNKQIRDIKLLANQYYKINKDSKYMAAKNAYFKFMFDNVKEGDLFSKFISNTYNLEKIDVALDKNKK
jgi:hypothetical protein